MVCQEARHSLDGSIQIGVIGHIHIEHLFILVTAVTFETKTLSRK